MMGLPQKSADPAAAESDEAASAPLSGTRAQRMHRLQLGVGLLAGMVLLVGLANIIQNRARVTEENAVPEAAPTVEPDEQPVQRDPLADAGVVPDLPTEPTPTPSQAAPILPEQGNAIPVED